ncbi:MAG: aldehyde dehydrogenase [Bacteroidia bacterium]|nr:MAG: aldehyde dehydrogenase [Bacteroidia bacterium]
MQPQTVQETSLSEIQNLLEKQRNFFLQGRTLEYRFRLQQLKLLKQIIKAHESEILEALKSDLNKAEFEGYATEVGFTYEELNHAISHLKSWMRPKTVWTPMTQFWAVSKIYPKPYGVSLIIAPWNYPFQLLFAPLIGAISAGCTAILKSSELAPATSAIAKKLITKYFQPEYVALVEGGVETSQYLLQQKWDIIFFTGSTQVGKIVMQAAAKHLTPVVLELGGKSPCIVDETAHLDFAARRIVWGKLVNAGQTCVAPDYLLVHESIKQPLVQKIIENIKKSYGDDPAQSPDYPRIINEKHFIRLTNYLKDGNIIFGGQTNIETRYIAPTLLDNVNPESPVMQEEIFGPILPILTYKNLQEAIDFINTRPKPLALYVYTNSSENERRVLNYTDSGGGCINDCLVHLAPQDLPFGGVGESGMGNYHGKASFDAFSHPRGILKKTNLFDIPIRYAPYLNKIKLLKYFMK